MTTLMDPPKLQAVLLADSFASSGCPFQPLSLDQPKVLCPLNNVALLSYALDCLASNGVEQVFVVCTNDAVEDYLTAFSSERPRSQQQQSQTSSSSSSWQGQLTVEVIKDTSLTNAGDALRELYKRNIIQSDPFLLLFGDVITNMDLRQAMEMHKARHASDSSAIMTVVLSANGGDPTAASRNTTNGGAGGGRHIQSAKHDLVVAYDESQQDRVLMYDNHCDSKSVRLPCSFFAAHPGMTVRTDLSDTGVYICSPDVLGRFEDEFDYLDIAHDFIANCVAEEEEGLQTRIHAHILSSSSSSSSNHNPYAARVVDWATYHAISKDLLKRWCYPMVPDNLSYYASASLSLTQDQLSLASTTQQHPSLYAIRNYPLDWYKETTAPSKIARTATLTGSGMLGSRGQIHDHATVHSSVVGHDVTIQRHAVVQESHIWDQVVIEESAQVRSSVLAKNVTIQKGAIVNKCIIGQGCVIGAGVVLPEYTRITLHPPEDHDPFGDGGDHDDWGDDDDEDDNEDDDEMPGNNRIGGIATPSTSSNNLAAKSETDTLVVGKDGKGFMWHPSLEDDDEDEDDANDEEQESGEDPNDGVKNSSDGFSNLQLQSIGTDLRGYYQKRLQRQAEPPDDFSDDEVDPDAVRIEDEAFAAYTEGAFTFADTPSTVTTSISTVVMGRQKGVDVVKELKEICMEFDDNGGTPIENLAIELNSYKFSQNASYADCTMAAILAIVDKMQITADTKDGKLVSGLKQKLEVWSPLLQKMCMGEAEEIAIIHGLERAATAGTPPAEKLSSGLSFRFFLQTLHDAEILSEEAILAWADERKSEPDIESPVGKLFRLPSVQDFLEWLQEDESEDSSSGEDST